MAGTLKHGFHVSCLGEVITSNASKTEGNSGFSPSHSLPSDFIVRNKNLVVSHQQGFSEWNMKSPSNISVHVSSIIVSLNFSLRFTLFKFWVII